MRDVLKYIMDYYLTLLPPLFVALGFIISETMIEANEAAAEININKNMLLTFFRIFFFSLAHSRRCRVYLKFLLLVKSIYRFIYTKVKAEVRNRCSRGMFQPNATCFIPSMSFRLNRNVIQRMCKGKEVMRFWIFMNMHNEVAHKLPYLNTARSRRREEPLKSSSDLLRACCGH